MRTSLRSLAAAGLTATAVLMLAAPSPAQQARRAESPPPTPTRIEVQTVVEGVEIPWAIAFTSPHRMLFTERSGQVRVVEHGQLRSDPLHHFEGVRHRRGSEIGLMGMALHPEYPRNGWIYFAYGHTEGDVRIVRLRDEGDRLADKTFILAGIPAGANHAGCAIAFGPDGKLYITTGDTYRGHLAQDLSSLAGKTLRVNDDGTVPSDNPFVGRDGVRPEIWSFGHRNAQGIAWHPETGLMFQTEHGPSGSDGPGGGDELNVVEAGKNYGWPHISHDQTRAGMEPPALHWTPAVAPASAAFYRGELFPGWHGSLLVGNLRGNSIYRVEVDGREVVRQETVVSEEYGRIRAVVEGPDGAIYFSTSNRDGRGRPGDRDDRILRIVPKPDP